jgi:hypothetical protein
VTADRKLNEALARSLLDEAIQTVQRVTLHVALVKAEGEKLAMAMQL